MKFDLFNTFLLLLVGLLLISPIVGTVLRRQHALAETSGVEHCTMKSLMELTRAPTATDIHEGSTTIVAELKSRITTKFSLLDGELHTHELLVNQKKSVDHLNNLSCILKRKESRYVVVGLALVNKLTYGASSTPTKTTQLLVASNKLLPAADTKALYDIIKNETDPTGTDWRAPLDHCIPGWTVGTGELKALKTWFGDLTKGNIVEVNSKLTGYDNVHAEMKIVAYVQPWISPAQYRDKYNGRYIAIGTRPLACGKCHNTYQALKHSGTIGFVYGGHLEKAFTWQPPAFMKGVLALNWETFADPCLIKYFQLTKNEDPLGILEKVKNVRGGGSQ